MSRRNRIFLGVLALFALGVGVLLYGVTTDLDTRYRESAEESLVDTAHLLSAFIETDMRSGKIDPARLRTAFRDAYSRRFKAHIYGITKGRVELRAYVVDANGMVIYDSLGKSEGQDFRGWRDVRLALAGEYGARTTPDNPEDPETAVMYVTAPIYDLEGVVGAVSVGKSVAANSERVATARQKLLSVGLITLAAFVVLLIVVSVWLVRPFGFIGDLMRLLRQEGMCQPRRLMRRIFALVSAAFIDMRDALAGRSYTEQYVQALTHEIKSPLAAIRAAAELLRGPIPNAQRERFSASIDEQVLRLQDLADRLLELASLEKRRTLDEVRAVNLAALVAEAVAALQVSADAKNLKIGIEVDEGLAIEGELFLLQRALVNLLANAIDFSPAGSSIEISTRVIHHHVELCVRDHGAGLPDYALDRAFEKFYSLRRPDSGRKSTGLGLPFVREIAHLHGGNAYIANHPQGGAEATLSLPLPPDKR